MRGDGCDMVGMTAMPEAALAMERSIAYASIAVIANWAAGITDEEISMAEILAVLEDCIFRTAPAGRKAGRDCQAW